MPVKQGAKTSSKKSSIAKQEAAEATDMTASFANQFLTETIELGCEKTRKKLEPLKEEMSDRIAKELEARIMGDLENVLNFFQSPLVLPGANDFIEVEAQSV